MKKTYRTFLISFSVIIVFLLFVFVSEISGVTWSKRVLFQSCQGDYIKYTPDAAFCLTIYKQQNTISRKFFIFITRKGDNDYGYSLNIPIDADIYENEIGKTRIMWTAEGIEITFTTGHKLFVPKQTFIAGR